MPASAGKRKHCVKPACRRAGADGKGFLNGTDMIHYSAIVAAWVGEKDLALQNLAKAAQLPGFLSYGRLKLLPWYDPLRGDPRFEKIVASLAPKE